MQLSETEWKVMRVVWKRHPASVRDVFEALEPDTSWAYSTVKTILSRLAEKGAVSVTKRGNASLFAPTVSAGDARRSALKALLDRAFDGTFGGLVQHLADEGDLSDRDRSELAELLAQEAAEESAAPGGADD